MAQDISLETEFTVRKFQHMVDTVKMYLYGIEMESVDLDSIDYMVHALNCRNKVNTIIENLLESGDFLKVYETAYSEIYDDID